MVLDSAKVARLMAAAQRGTTDPGRLPPSMIEDDEDREEFLRHVADVKAGLYYWIPNDF
ncbi:MAG: hypothetical protein ABIQ73_01380 [Acidimicrobiales bacterium]